MLGQDSHSWDHNWAGSDLDTAVRSAACDHMTLTFAKHLPRAGRVLEGGCGVGQYVVYYRQKGYNMVGLDFAPGAIARLKKRDATLPVVQGDVSRLPFEDASFDAYYSGGVIEHFEDGPTPVLAEARRVLKPKGKLIITVPYVNPIRAARFRSKNPTRADGMLLKRVHHFEVEPTPDPKYRFSEYMFTLREYRKLLRAHGFKVHQLRPCDFVWGDVGQWLLKRRKGPAAPESAAHPKEPAPARDKPSDPGYLRRLMVMEDGRSVPFGPMVKLLNRVSGHLAMAICTPGPIKA